MKFLMRDDVIGIDAFLQARLKYEPYLQLLKDCGNYCFLDQFKRHYGSEKGDYLISCLQDHNLVRMETLNNNYKYVYLTDTAMKYLLLKDDPRDFEKKKNAISVQKVAKYPTEKQLLASALKFELLVEGNNQILIKDNLIDNWAKFYKINEYEEGLKNIDNKLGALQKEHAKLEEEYKERAKKIVSTFDGMYKESENSLLKERLDISLKIRKLEEELNTLSIAEKITKEKKLKTDLELLKEKLALVQHRLDCKQNLDAYLRYEADRVNKVSNEFSEVYAKRTEIKEQYDEVKKKYDEIKKKVINLYDISKIAVYIGTKNEDKILDFIIFDIGNFKNAYHYLSILDSIKKLGIKFKPRVTIISYSPTRVKNLSEEFKEIQKKKIYKGKENPYYNRNIELCTVRSTYELEKYKKNLSKSENYIKKKDVKTVAALKETFSKKCDS